MAKIKTFQANKINYSTAVDQSNLFKPIPAVFNGCFHCNDWIKPAKQLLVWWNRRIKAGIGLKAPNEETK